MRRYSAEIRVTLVRRMDVPGDSVCEAGKMAKSLVELIVGDVLQKHAPGFRMRDIEVSMVGFIPAYNKGQDEGRAVIEELQKNYKVDYFGVNKNVESVYGEAGNRLLMVSTAVIGQHMKRRTNKIDVYKAFEACKTDGERSVFLQAAGTLVEAINLDIGLRVIESKIGKTFVLEFKPSFAEFYARLMKEAYKDRENGWKKVL